MAKIEDLISQVAEDRLRAALFAEVKALKRTKKFGLVFEEHLPETIRLPRLSVRRGEIVALKRGHESQHWRVVAISGDLATCQSATIGEEAVTETFPVDELVVVRRFGDPIYPALVPIDRIRRSDDKRANILINAENFHALQLLLYAYERKIDVIYIDPPYNTGARDWKYNNDYVDTTDAFRHSKWLSMMKRRLLLARRLLSEDGVLIVTIDEHEVHHLGNLLEDLYSDMDQQMVTIVINQKGVSQGRLARVEEYALYAFSPGSSVQGYHDDMLSPDRSDNKRFQTPRWEWLLRGGNNSRREDRPGLFYPIFVDPQKKAIVGVGEVMPLSESPDVTKLTDRTVAWPIRTDGSFGNWQTKPDTLRALIELGFVRLGGYHKKRGTWTVQYLNRGTRTRIADGEIVIVGRDELTKSVQIEYASDAAKKRNIKTVWHRGAHDSGIYGSGVLRAMVGPNVKFQFPKSLYAVRDTIATVTRHKKNAIVLDFFAGSGTTLHATALLNSEDGGTRQCILVTNNEVDDKEAKQLLLSNILPGDADYEAKGVCEAVTWPRCKAAVAGTRSGIPLDGEYLTGRPFSEGFEENIEYFRLDFLDPNEVARGDALASILPILWLLTSCQGDGVAHVQTKTWVFP
jgi:adenine-specific DNA-methyltransferase